MTEPIEVTIQVALYAHFATPELTRPATPRAPPFVTPAYVPVTGVAYYDVKPILRAAPEHFGIDYDNSDILSGIFQVDAVAPLGKGEGPGLRLAALVAARFAIGTRLVASGRRLEIIATPTIAAAVTDAPWVRFPVSIPYRVIT